MSRHPNIRMEAMQRHAGTTAQAALGTGKADRRGYQSTRLDQASSIVLVSALRPAKSYVAASGLRYGYGRKTSSTTVDGKFKDLALSHGNPQQ